MNDNGLIFPICVKRYKNNGDNIYCQEICRGKLNKYVHVQVKRINYIFIFAYFFQHLHKKKIL